MKKSRNIDQLKEVAYHEAGHAAMHLLRLEPFDYVTINPDKDSSTLGQVKMKELSYEERIEIEVQMPFEFAVNQIMFFWAGPIAQGIYLGKYPSWGSGSDDDSISDFVLRITGSDLEEQRLFQEWIMYKTTTQLKNNWSLVTSIATALLEKKTISYDETRVIFSVHMKLYCS